MMLTQEERTEAYEMWLNHHTFNQIARLFNMKQGKIIHIVMQEHRRQNIKCQRCRWRKDGQAVCLLPTCMHELGKQKRKRRGRVWRWRKS